MALRAFHCNPPARKHLYFYWAFFKAVLKVVHTNKILVALLNIKTKLNSSG
jgi:hypothetical protein